MKTAESSDKELTKRRDLEELLGTGELPIPGLRLDVDKLIDQFTTCLKAGGAYPIADAISGLATYTDALPLTDVRTAELVQLLVDLEAASGTTVKIMARCRIVSAMLKMVLDSKNADISAACKLFDKVGDLTADLRMAAGNQAPFEANRLVGEIVGQDLEEACTCPGSLANVAAFAASIEEISQGGRDVNSTAFLKSFVGNNLANF